MNATTQTVPRSGPGWRLPVVLVAVLGMAALSGTGCTPDIPQAAPPTFLELQFDPSTNPPLAFQPTILVTNAETGLLDFSAAGIIVPADPAECQTQTDLPVAACEFYWYMQQLDGFPTLTPISTPVITHGAGDELLKTPLDPATLSLPDNLFIYEFLRGQAPVTDGTAAYDADAATLTFDPTGGWDIGGLYLVAIRGYANGIKDTDGNEAVKSIIYVLLSQDSSLTCEATTAADISESCEYYSLFAGDPRFSTDVYPDPTARHAAIGATLLELEQLRQVFKGQSALPFDLWSQVADPAFGNMPIDEVGILWAFRTHTNSVIELNPNLGLAPFVVGTKEIHVTPKGTIDADTLTIFSLDNPAGAVFLLDGTAFAQNDLLHELPPFTVALAGGDIVLTTTDDLTEGHQYILVFSTEVEGKGKPLAPSPVTVFLRTRGELVDNFDNCANDPPTATPLVPGLKSADACQLEAGRQQFMPLFDDPTVKTLTVSANRPDGLTRELTAYVYGFVYTAQ
jgi:hypothetical protein